MIGGYYHDEIVTELKMVVEDFVKKSQIDANVTKEETIPISGTRRVPDVFVNTADKYPPLTIEFETGNKSHQYVKRKIGNRFEHDQSIGLQPILCADGFVLAGGGESTVMDVAKRNGAEVVELKHNTVKDVKWVDGKMGETNTIEESIAFKPRTYGDNQVYAQLASFLDSMY